MKDLAIRERSHMTMRTNSNSRKGLVKETEKNPLVFSRQGSTKGNVRASITRMKKLLLHQIFVFYILLSATGYTANGTEPAAFPSIDSLMEIFTTPLVASQKISKDQVVALVNEEKISIQHWVAETRKLRFFTQSKTLENETDEKTFSKKSLENLIIQRLILQTPAAQRIKISEDQVFERLQVMRDQFKKSQLDFNIHLQQVGLTLEEIKRAIHDELQLKEVIAQLPFQKQKVSEEEIRSFYENNQELFKIPSMTIVNHLFSPNTDTKPDPKELTETFNEIQQALNNQGGDKSVLENYRLAPFPIEYQKEIRIPETEIIKVFDPAKYPPGSWTEIGRLSDGLHSFQILGHEKGRSASFAESRAAIVNKLESERKNKAFTSYIKTLREEADIQILVKP